MSRSRTTNIDCVALILTLFSVTITSCGSGPPAVRPPNIDASTAGQMAMEIYDSDGDGRVAGDELEQAPSLKAALSRLDTDGDKAVSADELAARVESWQATKAGLMSFSFTVTLDGSPLAGATVTFEPEPFLGDDIKAATCITSDYGGGGAAIPRELRPDPTSPPGMHLGLYQVKISKVVGGKQLIPRKYNEETILGQEVSYDVPEIAGNRVLYALTSK